MTRPLSQQRFSVDHDLLETSLATSKRLLIIQDLDGVCMGLVRNPLDRAIDAGYVRAVRAMAGHIQVLTNGEHIGKRGVNPIVEKAVGKALAREEGLYLPGLAAGGVQLQNRFGKVSHPGVSTAEQAFLLQVPVKARYFLINLLGNPPYSLAKENIQLLSESVVLDNRVSPTINANLLTAILGSVSVCRRLQEDLQAFMESLLEDARKEGLGDSFFIHYAPNRGTDDDTGKERVDFATDGSWGTTDFQFMLRGAIKEVGVLVLLNQYYASVTGEFPLGKDFNARRAPRNHLQLLQLVADHFDPALMPRIVGVGDTITSHLSEQGYQRGGSDRGFLTLIQELGQSFHSDNTVVLVDSSSGELPRPAIDPEGLQRWPSDQAGYWQAVQGLSDASDPLQVNFVFPGGYREYTDFFKRLAALR